jgi:hypothetical protein
MERTQCEPIYCQFDGAENYNFLFLGRTTYLGLSYDCWVMMHPKGVYLVTRYGNNYDDYVMEELGGDCLTDYPQLVACQHMFLDKYNLMFRNVAPNKNDLSLDFDNL